MNLITPKCPGCHHGTCCLMDCVDHRNKVYGYRARCSNCDRRTVTAKNYAQAREFFALGRFIAEEGGRK